MSAALADPDAPPPPALLAEARALDAADALAPFALEFAKPTGGTQPALYLCGHSLGLAPRSARAHVLTELERWEALGVRAHHEGARPWLSFAEPLAPLLAPLVGAQASEVIAMNSLTVNLHLMLASFYRPRGKRRAILVERGVFPSDRHALTAQIAWHGLDPAVELIELAPSAGEDTLSCEAIEARIAAEAERLALVLWPGVQFLTGQRFDLARITRAAHAAGAYAGFDLAHAIGNVPVALHADGADFAVWCSYKYLNAGAGAIGGAFVHERHHARETRLAGWWGHEPGTRFEMGPAFVPAPGAAGFAVSNPPILSTAPLYASLDIFARAGLEALRRKSVALTGYLQRLLLELVPGALRLVTPREAEQRGAQLSLRVERGLGGALGAALGAHGLIADWREPDILRLAPAPLYISFEEVLRAAWVLARVLPALAGPSTRPARRR